MFDLGYQFDGQAVPFDRGHPNRCGLLEQAAGLGDDHFLADPARELGDQRVQAAAQLVPPPRQISVMLDQQPTSCWASR